MDQTGSTVLLEDVKLSLNITWQDYETDRTIQNLIDNGAAYLNDKLGAAGDYLSPGYPRMLLFEYVRYARDAALDVFENNYQSLLLAMKNNRLVTAFAAICTAQRDAEGRVPYGEAAGDS